MFHQCFFSKPSGTTYPFFLQLHPETRVHLRCYFQGVESLVQNEKSNMPTKLPWFPTGLNQSRFEPHSGSPNSNMFSSPSIGEKMPTNLFCHYLFVFFLTWRRYFPYGHKQPYPASANTDSGSNKAA